MNAEVKERWHGTTGGYTYHKCKCVDCRKAIAAWQRSARKRRQESNNFAHSTHGTRSCYGNGCRCDECKAANAEYVNAWNKRQLT